MRNKTTITVLEKDFVVGDVYQDIDDGYLKPILFEFVSKDEKSCYFKLVSAKDENKWYVEEDGLIGFPLPKLYMFKKVDAATMILNEIGYNSEE